MKDFSRVIVSGRLVARPIVRNSTTNIIAKARIACNEKIVDKQHTNFFDLTFFSPQSQYIIKEADKGDKYTIIGSLRQEKWVDKYGNNRKNIEIVVDSAIKTSAAYNKRVVVVMGRLSEDIKVVNTKGAIIANGSIAFNTLSRSDGELIRTPNFIDIKLFNKLAEIGAEYGIKGRVAMIYGRLRYEEWQHDDSMRSKVYIIVDELDLV